MIACTSSIIFRGLKRCNMVLTLAGSVYTLFGVPVDVAKRFCDAFEGDDDPNSDKVALRMNSLDIMKKSVLQSHFYRYVIMLVLLWAAIILFSSDLVTTNILKTVSDLVFSHMIIAGTLILSIGLPTILIWLWALTGGYLKEFNKYYKFSAVRKKNSITLKYGFLVRRRIIISVSRIAIVEYRQTPMMRIFGYGNLNIRAVGYNSMFVKSQIMLPLVRESQLAEMVIKLIPEMPMDIMPRSKRTFRYYLYSWKSFLPLICFGVACFLGYAWVIVGLVIAAILVISYILEYRFTYFHTSEDLTLLSKGGLYRTAACIKTERIELVAKSGGKRKQSQGYVDVILHVFGKKGSYAKVRNISIDKIEKFDLPESKFNNH